MDNISEYLRLCKISFFYQNIVKYIININFRSYFGNLTTLFLFSFFLFYHMFYSPHCPRVNVGLTVFPSVHSGCGGQNMAASQGRLVGFRGLHSTKCLLRTTNISTAKATTSKGIGAKECRKTFFTSFLRQGRTIPAILKSWKRHK